MYRIKSLSLKQQLSIWFILIIITVFSSGLYAYSISANILYKKTIEYNNQAADQIEEKVSYFFSNIDVIMDSFVYNTVLQDFILENDPYEKSLLAPGYKNLASNYIALNTSIVDIIVRSSDGDIFSMHYNTPVVDRLTALTDTNYNVSRIITIDYNDVFSISKPIYRLNSVKEKIGDCIFVINVSELRNNILSSYENFYILDINNTIIAGEGSEMTGSVMSDKYTRVISTLNDYDKTYIDGKQYLLQKRAIENTGWKAVSIVLMNDLIQDLVQVRYYNIILWICSIGLLTLIFMIFFKNIAHSINDLLHHMGSVKKGNFSSRTEYPHVREFGILAKGFNEMMDNIVHLTNKNMDIQKKLYETEISNKEAKLLALQSQINPHFLYNTLDCMKSIGIYYKVKEIQEISTALAFIFRYAIKGDNIVKISDEIECVQYYLKIQQIRFIDKFQVYIDIDYKIKRLNIMKFLLQPLVENAIFHALEPKTGAGCIWIQASLIDEVIEIVVKDDGMGMDEETLQNLIGNMNHDTISDSEKPSTKRSIGLSNIHKRIKLLYGTEYGLHISSQPNSGTTVTIRIPKL